MRLLPRLLTLFVLCVSFPAFAQEPTDDLSDSSQEAQPNIIIFMVDDLGWNHLSATKGAMKTQPAIYQTPNLEKLARGGLSFTHAYAQPNCAPTRAAMLSGQYPARIHNDVYVVRALNRFGRGGMTKSEAKYLGPGQSEDVSVEAITIAEALKQNGYATAHIGKYHVGGHGTKTTLPENVGFDTNLGGFSQGHQPVCFASKQQGKWKFRAVGRGDFDRWAAPYTAEYVEQRGLSEELIGTSKHISDALGDAIQTTIKQLTAQEKPFYLQFHTYAVHGPLKARPDLKQAALERLGKKFNKRLLEYVGFIASVDENVGRLLATLEDPNGDGDSSDSITENTLILFTSDNGGTHTDNLPLKGVKGQFTEGGIRVPLIAYWPSVIPANTVTDYKVHAVDYYPTCLSLAGKKWTPPVTTHPLDGESFADILRHPQTDRSRGPIFYLFPGYLDRRATPCVVAIDEIQGKRYKLTFEYESQSWLLYCLTEDQAEAENLIETRPEIAKRLSKKINTWLTQDHPTWQPKYPIQKENGQPAGPPPLF
ncbi:Arylsulfatase A [Planctomycetales bacterium 10988]|nr:Arylsulfatase A [Planctomycetales bacterium 10988]